MPALEPERRSYHVDFAKMLPKETIIIGPPALSEIPQLRSEENWFNGVHAQKQGAKVFTEWLAKEILKKKNYH